MYTCSNRACLVSNESVSLLLFPKWRFISMNLRRVKIFILILTHSSHTLAVSACLFTWVHACLLCLCQNAVLYWAAWGRIINGQWDSSGWASSQLKCAVLSFLSPLFVIVGQKTLKSMRTVSQTQNSRFCCLCEKWVFFSDRISVSGTCLLLWYWLISGFFIDAGTKGCVLSQCWVTLSCFHASKNSIKSTCVTAEQQFHSLSSMPVCVGWWGGSVARASVSRSKDQGSNYVGSTRTICESFSESNMLCWLVVNVLKPLCVCACIKMITYARLWSCQSSMDYGNMKRPSMYL